MRDEIDELFKLPLGEFTPARNALVTALKKAGDQSRADAVRALLKPSVPAWVINQLFWRHREPFDQLLEAGDRSRQIQSSQRTRTAADLRENLEARREAQAVLMRLAAGVLSEGGYSGARDMLRRVSSTLEALATYGTLADAPRAGRLTAEIEPAGFDLVAAMLSPSGGGPRSGVTKLAPVQKRKPESPQPSKVSRASENRARAAALRKEEEERRRLAVEAKGAVRDAERAVRTARTRTERVAVTLAASAALVKKSERLRAQAEKELAKRVAEANASRERAQKAEEEVQQAAGLAETAERALDLARATLAQLTAKHK